MGAKTIEVPEAELTLLKMRAELGQQYAAEEVARAAAANARQRIVELLRGISSLTNQK